MQKSSERSHMSHGWLKSQLYAQNLFDEMFCFSLMHDQCCFLCPLWMFPLFKCCTVKGAILICDINTFTLQSENIAHLISSFQFQKILFTLLWLRTIKWYLELTWLSLVRTEMEWLYEEGLQPCCTMVQFYEKTMLWQP